MHKPIHEAGKTLLLAICLAGPAFAQPAGTTTEKRELIYCADRMTPEERAAYRAKIQAARSTDEKDAVRAAQRTEMQARVEREGTPGYCDQPLQQRLRLREGQQDKRP